MKPLTAVVLSAGMFLLGSFAQAQTTPATQNWRGTLPEAIRQAGVLKKSQESILTALAAQKASREMLNAQVAVTEKSLLILRTAIEQIDEQYDSLNEVQQSSVRDAWSLAKIFGVFVEYLKDTTAKPDSPDREKDLKTNSESASRRAAMLEETLTKLAAESLPQTRPQGRPQRQPSPAL